MDQMPQPLTADPECSTRLLCFDRSPSQEMQNEKNYADDEQNVEQTR